MHEIKVTEVGTFQVTHTIQLTDEQWAEAVDPTTHLVVDVDLIADEVFNQSENGGMCARCSGWGKKFSLSLGDETEITEVNNIASGEVIYDRDYTEDTNDENEDDENRNESEK